MDPKENIDAKYNVKQIFKNCRVTIHNAYPDVFSSDIKKLDKKRHCYHYETEKNDDKITIIEEKLNKISEQLQQIKNIIDISLDEESEEEEKVIYSQSKSSKKRPRSSENIENPTLMNIVKECIYNNEYDDCEEDSEEDSSDTDHISENDSLNDFLVDE